MTYCLAISIRSGIIFASDSRTNAGPDQVATYGKMYTFGARGERQIGLLAAGNLATTQAVITQLQQDLEERSDLNVLNAASMARLAEYVGQVTYAQEQKHKPEINQAGFSVEASFILGGQIGSDPHQLFLIYPQGNFITSSEQTPFLQIGETKYGKTILDRIIDLDIDLDEAARCALVSMESTIKSNATVGPPIELLRYQANSLEFSGYLHLDADDPYLTTLMHAWDERLREAFSQVPHFEWGGFSDSTRFR
jgi:putative proteasome-type protease